MSRSPENPQDQREVQDYIAATRAYSRLILQGKSLSGRERNCVFLNCGLAPTGQVSLNAPTERQFANISAASGLDFPDDGRAVATVDWDQDGDLDVWITNRNAPRLRLMINQTHSQQNDSPPTFVAFKLQGTQCNRDAIGARIALVLKNRPTKNEAAPPATSPESQNGDRHPLVQTLYAGDAFLSQSSKWLHFGLGRDAAIESVTVRWPGGQVEQIQKVTPGRRYWIVQGSGVAKTSPPASRQLALSTAIQPVPTKPTISKENKTAVRVSLPEPFPMPVLEYQYFDAPAGSKPRPVRATEGPLLINLWASWCQPCRMELEEFTKHREPLRGAGLDLLSLSVDGLGDEHSHTTPQQAKVYLDSIAFPFRMGVATTALVDKLHIVQRLIYNREYNVDVPTSFLLDAAGRLAAIYRGRVSTVDLLEDVSLLTSKSQEWLDRCVPFAGRWYYPRRRIPMQAAVAQFRDRYPQDTLSYLELGLEEQREMRQQQKTLTDQAKTRADEALISLHLELSTRYEAIGQRQKAVENYRQALELAPENPEVHLRLGIVDGGQGNYNSAIAHYKRALTVRPDFLEAHENMAEILALQSKHDQAIKHFLAAVRIAPDNIPNRHGLAGELVQVGRLDEAIEHWQQAVRTAPDDVTLRVHLADALQQRGDHDQTAEQLLEAVRIDPDLADVRFRLANLLRAQGKMDEAIQHLQRAVRIQPDFAEAHYNLGFALATQRDWNAATRHFSEAIRVKPDYTDAHFNLARVYLRRNRSRDAITHLRSAVKLKPRTPVLLNHLAWLLATNADPSLRDAQAAVRLATTAVEITSHQDAAILDTLAAAHAAMGDFDSAVSTAKKAVMLTEAADQDASDIRQRMESYVNGQPYVAPSVQLE